MSTEFAFRKVVTDGLIFSVDAYNTKSYPGSGTNVNDLFNSGEVGALINGVGFDSSSWTFDGVNDRIDFTPTSEMSNLSTWTLEIWVKAEVGATGNWYLGLLGDTTGNDTDVSFGILWRYESNWVDARSSNGTAAKLARLTGNPSRGEWHQFINTYDGTDLKLWLNGKTVATLNDTFTPAVGPDILQYGSSTLTGTGLRPFEGDISHTRIYNRPLSESEIKQNYNAIKWRLII